MELLAGDLDFPVGIFGVDEAVVLQEALLAGLWSKIKEKHRINSRTMVKN